MLRQVSDLPGTGMEQGYGVLLACTNNAGSWEAWFGCQVRKCSLGGLSGMHQCRHLEDFNKEQHYPLSGYSGGSMQVMAGKGLPAQVQGWCLRSLKALVWLYS